jgi:hypothetical protein
MKVAGASLVNPSWFGRIRRSASKDGVWLAAIAFLLHLAGNPHYGFFRDELYFIVCGRHPAFGYVDQPPLVPLLAALSQLHYGEAAAIDVLSNDPAIPPTLSGHNQYWLWGPGDYDGAVLLDVGGDLRDDQTLCTSATMLGQFHAPYIMPYEDGTDIILCLGLRKPIGKLWPMLKHFE